MCVWIYFCICVWADRSSGIRMSIYAPGTKNKSIMWKTESKTPHHLRLSSIALFFHYIVKSFSFIVGCIDRNKLLPYFQCKRLHPVIKNHPKPCMCCTILPQSFKSGSFLFSARLLAQSIPYVTQFIRVLLPENGSWAFSESLLALPLRCLIFAERKIRRPLNKILKKSSLQYLMCSDLPLSVNSFPSGTLSWWRPVNRWA